MLNLNNNRIIKFLETYKGLLDLLNNIQNEAYDIDVKTTKIESSNNLICRIRIKTNILNQMMNNFESNSFGNVDFEISDEFTKEETRLIVNTIRNMFIEARNIHKPFIDIKRGEEVIENSKFYLITHFDSREETETNDASYFHDQAIDKFLNRNFQYTKKDRN